MAINDDIRPMEARLLGLSTSGHFWVGMWLYYGLGIILMLLGVGGFWVFWVKRQQGLIDFGFGLAAIAIVAIGVVTMGMAQFLRGIGKRLDRLEGTLAAAEFRTPTHPT